MFSKARLEYHQRVLDEITAMCGKRPTVPKKTEAQVSRENNDDAWATAKLAQLTNLLEPSFRHI